LDVLTETSGGAEVPAARCTLVGLRDLGLRLVDDAGRVRPLDLRRRFGLDRWDDDGPSAERPEVRIRSGRGVRCIT
jgi:hypothetical protein